METFTHARKGDLAPHQGWALPVAEVGCLHHSQEGVPSTFQDHKGPWHQIQIWEVHGLEGSLSPNLPFFQWENWGSGKVVSVRVHRGIRAPPRREGRFLFFLLPYSLFSSNLLSLSLSPSHSLPSLPSFALYLCVCVCVCVYESQWDGLERALVSNPYITLTQVCWWLISLTS